MSTFKGNIKFDGVDINDDVTQLEYKVVNAAVERRSTFGRDRVETPGAKTRSLTVTFYSNDDTGASAVTEAAAIFMAAAEDSDVHEIEGTFADAIVSAQNPRYTWDIYVLEAGFGGTDGEHTSFTTTVSVIGPPLIENI